MAAKKHIEGTSYDLYGRSGGGWSNLGTFLETEQFEALSAAEEADNSGSYDAVRLMSVLRFRDGRAPQETVAWMSPHLTRGKAPQRKGGGAPPPTGSSSPGAVKSADGGGGGSRTGGGNGADGIEAAAPGEGGGGGGAGKSAEGGPLGPEGGRRGKKKRKGEKAGKAYKAIVDKQLGRDQVETNEALEDALDPREVGGTVTRLVTVGLLSAAAAYIVTVPAEIAVKAFMNTGIELPSAIKDNFPTLAALIGFVLAALIIGKMILKENDLDSLTTIADQIQKMFAGDGRGTVEFNDEDEGGSWRQEMSDDIRATQEAEEEEARRQADEDRLAAAAERGEAGDDGEKDVLGTGELAKDVPPDSRMTMLKFLEGTLSAIKGQMAKLNNLGRFGVNLYLAGAGTQLAQDSDLDEAARKGMISESIVAFGTRKNMAGAFLDKFSDYEKDVKCTSLIDAGRQAMKDFVAGNTSAFKALPQTLSDFTSERGAKAAAGGVVVIMFTDLVGSTKLTQELGDVGAQAVVRTHNAIVRNALSAYHGREVKHTGDGIMAVFSNASNAVGATMVMQQEFQKYNASAGSGQVLVRIGLNAGAAVEEENDFYGAAVQLSARVCDKADVGQIFVTASVRDLVKGSAIQFRDAGSHAMKGISEPVACYEVVWQQAMAVAS